MPAPKRNKYAAKPREERHTESLYIKLRKEDKRRILEAAGPNGVTDWARRVLLQAAEGTFSEGEPSGAAGGNLATFGLAGVYPAIADPRVLNVPMPLSTTNLTRRRMGSTFKMGEGT